MAKLYDIAEEYETLLNFDMETEEDVMAFKELFNDIKENFDVKAENICKLIRNIESDASQLKEEKIKLEKKQMVLEHKAEAIRSYLALYAKQFLQDGEKRRVGLFTFGFRKNAPKLVVDATANIPDRFYKQVLDLQKLKDEVKKGASYTGVRLEAGESFIIN